MSCPGSSATSTATGDVRFADRRHAGQALGEAVRALNPPDPVVYALPRGGVPVGFEVARALECPLDVLVVRKLGVPYQPELAMGALGEGGLVVRNEGVVAQAGISAEVFGAVVDAETVELRRRLDLYRGDRSPAPAEGRTSIVVDDGLATGATAEAAVSVLRGRDPEAVWLAVPVAPRSGLDRLAEATDEFVVLSRPRRFAAVGMWYDDFTQTTDDEVRTLLHSSRLA